MRNTYYIASFFFGALVALATGAVLATVPNPFPFPTSELSKRTSAEHGTVVAGATAATATFAVAPASKGILIVNEGSDTARICPDGATTPTASVGVKLAAGASFSDANWSSSSFKYIRAGSSDTTLTYYVTY